MKTVQNKITEQPDTSASRRAVAGNGVQLRIPRGVPLKQLFIVSRPGSGKATSVVRMMLKMIEAGIPFVLIDEPKHGFKDRATRHRQPCFKNSSASRMPQSKTPSSGGSNT